MSCDMGAVEAQTCPICMGMVKKDPYLNCDTCGGWGSIFMVGDVLYFNNAAGRKAVAEINRKRRDQQKEDAQ